MNNEDFTPATCTLKAFLTLNEDPSYDPPVRIQSSARIHRDDTPAERVKRDSLAAQIRNA